MGLVPRHKSCNGVVVSTDLAAVEYVRCPHCRFIWCPAMCSWPATRFKAEIYNADYVKVDPDSAGARARNNAHWLAHTFEPMKHIDYGCGNGMLSAELRKHGWDTTGYDPFYAQDTIRGAYTMVTAFEVVEHVPDQLELMRSLVELMEPTGILVFSTLLSDTSPTTLDWWYLAPRNGHVCIHSFRSLWLLCTKFGLYLQATGGLHIVRRHAA